MASLTQIRAALKATLEAAITELVVPDKVPGTGFPSDFAVPVPSTGDFVVSMGQSSVTWAFDLAVVVPTADLIVAQSRLDPLVDVTGARSITRAVFGNRGLGLSNVDAHVGGMSGYGLRYEWIGIDHVGASLSMTVHTSI